MLGDVWWCGGGRGLTTFCLLGGVASVVVTWATITFRATNEEALWEDITVNLNDLFNLIYRVYSWIIVASKLRVVIEKEREKENI